MMTREELDTAIVGAVDTYREAKRAELVKAVEDDLIKFDKENT